MKIQNLGVDAVLASLRSTAQGLASSEAARRLLEYGANRIEHLRHRHWSLRLLQEFTQLFSIILWAAAALALWVHHVDPSAGMLRVALALVVVIVVSGVFSFWQEARVERTLSALQQLLPPSCKVMRDGLVRTLAAETVVPGDVILLAAGDNIPADCRLIESFGVRVNRSTVTGESRPTSCSVAPSNAEQLLDSRNVLLAGTSLVAGRGTAVVFATGAHSEFGKIARLTQTVGAEASPLRLEIARLSRQIAMLAVGLGAAFFLLGRWSEVPFWRDLILALGIIVALVPEGLLPTLTLSLVLAAQRMARRHVLIRHLPAVETLGSVTVICTDKTGTLTENRLRAAAVYLDAAVLPVAQLAPDSACVAAHPLFFRALQLCQDAVCSAAGTDARMHGDPLDVALLDLGQRIAPLRDRPQRCDERPFDSERMRQVVVCEEARGAMLYCKGALEAVLPLCTTFTRDGVARPLDEAVRAELVDAQNAMAAQGLRVIMIAARPLPAGSAHAALEQDLIGCGLVGLIDPPRTDVASAIASCRDAGIKVIMVTGDHPGTALAVARQIGLGQGEDMRVMTGEEVSRIERNQLLLALDAPAIVFARVAADQKMRIVEALKAKGHTVAVTGDGVNDAPALRAAHIGIAMGMAGSDVAKEAAAMVLLDDHFASIVNAIEEGRAVFQNIRRFLTYVLVHNVAELLPCLAFALFGIPLPLTPVQALAIDIGTDSLTALGLGVEACTPATMRRPPRRRAQALLSMAVALRAYVFLGLYEAGAALATFFHVLAGGGWQYGQDLQGDALLYRQATTACLSAIVMLQVVNVFLCRSAVRSLFSTGIRGNRLIVAGVALECVLLLLFVYSAWGHTLLATAALPRSTWLYLLPWMLGMVALEELRKACVRRRLPRR